MGYAANLCELMNKTGVSSCKLAKNIGVHTTTVTNWRGGTAPKIEHLKLVADYFGVTVDALLADDDTKEVQETG